MSANTSEDVIREFDGLVDDDLVSIVLTEEARRIMREAQSVLHAQSAELASLRARCDELLECLRDAPVRKGPFNWFRKRDELLLDTAERAKEGETK